MMKRIRCSVFITFSLLVFSYTACGFTSLSLIRDLVYKEDQILEVLKNFTTTIQESTEKLAPGAIHEMRYLESKRDWLLELYETGKVRQGNREERLAQILHPTSAVKLLTEFDSQVTDVLRKILNTRDLARIKKGLDVVLPKTTDINEAFLSLIRLQITYDIPVHDIYNGIIYGRQGSRLNPNDAFRIGKMAVQHGYMNESVEWLNFALNQKTANDTTFTEVDVYAYLAYVYYMQNESEKGLIYLQLACERDCRHEKVLDTLKLKLLSSNKVLNDRYQLLDEDEWHMYKETCRQDSFLLHSNQYHICRYRLGYNLPYFRFNEEVLSWYPYISIFYDVITDEEAETLKRKASDELFRSRTIGNEQDVDRSSANTFIFDKAHPDVLRSSQRIAAMTGLNTYQRLDSVSSAEPFQVVNYGIGGEYKPHVDADDSLHLNGGKDMLDAGDRLATFLIYLTDVEFGGATVFPYLRIKMPPLKNSAIFWYSYPPHTDEISMLSFHGGCPVVLGEKWVSNKWIWTNENMFKRSCGRTYNHTQLALECEHGKLPFRGNCEKIEDHYFHLLPRQNIVF